jgi:hypothetical protein
LQKSFENILEFTKVKEKCLFCETPLRACLTNFVGYKHGGIPILNEPIVKDRFSFLIRHTTPSLDIRADAVIDVSANILVLKLYDDSITERLDEYVAKQALDDMKPYIELYCPSKSCKNEYYISSYNLKINNSKATKGVCWIIEPLTLFLESFKTHSVLVQNDWIRQETNIYSIAHEDAKPIKVPFMDFEAMGKDKLLTRISTYVTFS